MTVEPEIAAPPNRTLTTTGKVKTEFGSLYLHVEVDDAGRPVGGALSTAGKEPESQISRLVDEISATLDRVLASAGGHG